MATNFTRLGSAFGVTALEKFALESTLTGGNLLPGMNLQPDTILGALNALIGVGFEFLSPRTMPSVMQGIADSGATLLGYRAGVNLKAQSAPTPTPYSVPVAPRMVGAPAPSAWAGAPAAAIGKQPTGTVR